MKKLLTYIISFIFIFSHDSYSFAKSDSFMGQLNRRVAKIQYLKTVRSKGELSAEQRFKLKNENFLKQIKGKISAQEFKLIEEEFEATRLASFSEMDQSYEDKMKKEVSGITEDSKKQWAKIYRPLVEVTKNTIENDTSYLKSLRQETVTNGTPSVNPLAPDSKDEGEEVAADSATEREQDNFLISENSDENHTLYSMDSVELTPEYEDTLFVILSKAYKRNFKRLRIIR